MPVSSANSTSNSLASALMIEHGQRLLDLHAVSGGLGQRQRLVGVDVEFDFSHLYVERQVDQHRAWTAGAHFVEGLLERVRHLARLHDGGCPLGHWLDDGGDVDCLEVFLVHTGAGCLAGDAQNRDRVGRGAVEPGDHVRTGRAGSADAHADVAGLGAGVTLGHVRGTFDVAREDVIDATDLLQGAVQRIDRGARDAKSGINPFTAHHQNGGFDCSHFAHGFVPLTFCNCIQVALRRVYSRRTAQVNPFSQAAVSFVGRPV
jgi:hypothetical protein